MKSLCVCIHAVSALCLLFAASGDVLAQSTAFSYQGHLNNNGAPVNGSYDLVFSLYATISNGLPTAGPITNLAVAVTNGVFDTTIDFGAGAFNGTYCWLDIALRTNGSASFTELAPRQAITTAPYSVMAVNAGNLLGILPANQLPVSAVTNNAAGITLNGSFNGNGNGLTNLNAAGLQGPGALPDGVLSANIPRLAADNGFTGNVYFNTNTFFADYTTISLGSSAGIFLNAGHSGAPETQFTSSGRIAIAPAYGIAYTGALQFGAAGFGTVQGSLALFYLQNSAYADADYPLGYGYTWLNLYNSLGSGGNVSWRAEAANTNGDGLWRVAYGTFTGTSTLNQGPLIGESLGITSIAVRVGPNSNSPGLYQYGALVRDTTNVILVGTNYGLDFDGPGTVRLSIFNPINITNIPLTFPQSNQVAKVELWINPGTATYTATFPTNWLWAADNYPALPVIPAMNQVKITVEQIVASGVTNWYAEARLYPKVIAYDTNALNVFAAIAQNGGALSPGQSNAINDYIISEKTDGNWTNDDVDWIFVGNTTNSMAVEIHTTNTAYLLGFFGGYTVNSDGVTGDGATAYVNTGWAPSGNGINYQLNSASMCFYTTSAEPFGVFLGSHAGSGNKAIVETYTPIEALYFLNASGQGAATLTPDYHGFYCFTENGARYFSYSPGNSTSGDGVPNGISTQPVYLLALNYEGGPGDGSYCNATISQVSFGGFKTPAMEAAKAADVLALETSLGRP